jgi:hypothetical protein
LTVLEGEKVMLYIRCGTGVGWRCSNKAKYIGNGKVGGSIHGRKDICDFFLECLLWTVDGRIISPARVHSEVENALKAQAIYVVMEV